MRTTVGLATLALGAALASPAFAQGAQPLACIHFQQACSDSSYAVTETGVAGPLYNVAPLVTHRHAQKTGTASSMQKIEQHERGYGPLYNYAPQPSAVQPCIRVQTFCL
jgi:hypothetical protein